MLELKNVGFQAEDDNKEILRDVSLKIDDKIVVITGPNGGGKSTLAKVIAGIVQPTSGQILLDGEDITNYSVTERAKAGISLAFQQPVRFKGLTVRDLVTIAAGHDLTMDEACSYLSEVGLCAKDYIYRQIDGTLSGGEMKRIEIASVLAKEHSLCIFDEPEAGIDLWSFSMLIQKFEEIHTEKKQSLIVISHQEKIINMADRIMIIDGGEIKKIGTKDEVLPYLNGVQKCHKCVERLEGRS